MGAASPEGGSPACGSTLSVGDIPVALDQELGPARALWPASYQPFLTDGITREGGGALVPGRRTGPSRRR